MSEYLSALSNAGLCEHLEKLEASDRAMAGRSERLRRELNDLEESDGPGASAADALRNEAREISERRSLLQEQIGELLVEREQRLASLRTRRKAA